jgi:hypothetical protein
MAELGIGPVPEGASPIDPFEVQVAGDALLVAYESYLLNADDVWTLTPDQRGVVLRADLSITPIAAPPDGVPMSWTTAIGSTALQLRPRNGGAFDIAPVSGMWAYELDTDTWRRIADPAWLACAGTDLGCKPFPTFEMGDPTLEVATRRGAVQLFDQTVGLYDPGLDEWTRLDDAPFPMALPDTLAMGDQVLVAPMRTFGNEYGLVGVLDLTTGTWTTDQIEFTPDDLARIDRYTDAGWDIRTDGTVVLLSPAQVQRGTNADPVATYDPATRSWSTPTPDDVATWQRFPTIFGNEML